MVAWISGAIKKPGSFKAEDGGMVSRCCFGVRDP